MTHTVLVMYPNEVDVHFDETYYMKTHVPLIENIWKSHGLISWHVTKFTTALDGSRPQYLVITTLQWKSEESVKAALQNPASAGVFADVPNFTNVKPITLAGSEL